MTTEEKNKITASNSGDTQTETAGDANTSTLPANTNRVDAINQMYDAQRQEQLSQLEQAYNQNKSNYQATADKIPVTYQEKANDLAAQYEKNRRNTNIQMQNSGLNTGAASQAQLAQNAAYLKNYAGLRTAEADASTETQRLLDDLEKEYQAKINQALATNDYNKAAALLNEYNNEYTRNLDAAKILAQYGDFSKYGDIYGKDVADGMATIWAAQNPGLAYISGNITEGQYNNLIAGRPINQGLDENGNVIGGVASGGGGGSSFDPWQAFLDTSFSNNAILAARQNGDSWTTIDNDLKAMGY